jgi:hypothetical protein
MKKKIICSSKLNAYVANQKAETVINAFTAENPAKMAGAAVEEKIHLRRVVVRSSARKRSKKLNPGETTPLNSSPFYAFVKQAGPVKVVVNVQTGEARVFANEDVISAVKVHSGKFTINGVTYAKKDTLNGFVRYEPVREKRSLRQKLSIHGPIVTAAMRALKKRL